MNGHLRAANSTIDVKGRLYLIRPVMSNKKGTIVTLGLRSKPQHNRLKPTRSKQVYDTCNVYSTRERCKQTGKHTTQTNEAPPRNPHIGFRPAPHLGRPNDRYAAEHHKRLPSNR